MPSISHYGGIPEFPSDGSKIDYQNFDDAILFSRGPAQFMLRKEELSGAEQKTELDIKSDVMSAPVAGFDQLAFGLESKSLATWIVLSLKKPDTDGTIILRGSDADFHYFLAAAAKGERLRASRSDDLLPLIKRDHQYVQLDVPLTIDTYDILEHEDKGTVYLTFTVHNAAAKAIRAIKAAVNCYDDFGTILNEENPLNLTIQHLNLEPGTSEKVGPVLLSQYADTRAVVLKVDQVHYADEVVDYETYVMVDRPGPLTGSLLDASVYAYGSKSRYLPFRTDFAWVCDCGWLNNLSLNYCYRCHEYRANIMGRTEESIRLDADEKKEREQELIWEQSQRRNREIVERETLNAHLAKRKKNRRMILILAILLVPVIAFGINAGLKSIFARPAVSSTVLTGVTTNEAAAAGQSASTRPMLVTRSTAARTTQAPNTEPAIKYGTVLSGGGVNVRDAAGMNGRIVGVAQSGTRLVLLQPFYDGGDWHQVEFEGQTAYIHKDRLSITGPDNSVAATTAKTAETTAEGRTNPPGTRVSNPIVISAEQLVSEIEANPAEARTKYFRRYLEVSGTVVFNANNSDMNGYYLVNTVSSRRTHVVCWFEPPNRDYDVGDFISVVGYCRSIEDGAELINCVIREG